MTSAEKMDSRRSLSSNVLVEGRNDRVGGHVWPVLVIPAQAGIQATQDGLREKDLGSP